MKRQLANAIDITEAKRALSAVFRAEVQSTAPDARRCIRDERMKLETAIRTWDASVVAQAKQAVEVAEGWEGFR